MSQTSVLNHPDMRNNLSLIAKRACGRTAGKDHKRRPQGSLIIWSSPTSPSGIACVEASRWLIWQDVDPRAPQSTQTNPNCAEEEATYCRSDALSSLCCAPRLYFDPIQDERQTSSARRCAPAFPTLRMGIPPTRLTATQHGPAAVPVTNAPSFPRTRTKQCATGRALRSSSEPVAHKDHPRQHAKPAHHAAAPPRHACARDITTYCTALSLRIRCQPRQPTREAA